MYFVPLITKYVIGRGSKRKAKLVELLARSVNAYRKPLLEQT